jgi:hypothetical protein
VARGNGCCDEGDDPDAPSGVAARHAASRVGGFSCGLGGGAGRASRRRSAGDALDIGFNVKYLLDVLNNVSAAAVQRRFGAAASSALRHLPADPEYKYVVMPLRI